MIIEFSIKNYRSIKELQTLSLIASSIKSKNPELDDNNLIRVSDKLSLLKTIAIYGANGSGKSNVIQALGAMIVFIRDSFKDDQSGPRLYKPFLLDNSSSNEPTFFQLIFICNNIKYRYGFELKENSIVSEWLFGTPGKKEVPFFTREGSNIQINEKQFGEGKDLKEKTSDHNLFLNVCKAFNGSVSKIISDYFNEKIANSSGLNDRIFRQAALDRLSDKEFKERIVSLLNVADFGIYDIEKRSVSENDMPENYSKEWMDFYIATKQERLLAKRLVTNKKGEIFEKEWTFDTHESEGTLKLFNYSAILINALMKGAALFIDEFDARLHPLLIKKIVGMFNSPLSNKNGAQLIFVTHDTNLLDNSLLRRDQIYFTEKNSNMETELYSLGDFKGIRNDGSYESDYTKGKYGAIPFLGNFEKQFE